MKNVNKLQPRINKKTNVAILGCSVFLLILGKLFVLFGERISHVDAQGILIDNPLLLLGGAFMLIAGVIGILAFVLMKIISWALWNKSTP